jgi:hypothetical protein
MAMMTCSLRRPVFRLALGMHGRRLARVMLVADRMLIMVGGHNGKPLDFEALERWTRVGYQRGWRHGAVSGESLPSLGVS